MPPPVLIGAAAAVVLDDDAVRASARVGLRRVAAGTSGDAPGSHRIGCRTPRGGHGYHLAGPSGRGPGDVCTRPSRTSSSMSTTCRPRASRTHHRLARILGVTTRAHGRRTSGPSMDQLLGEASARHRGRSGHRPCHLPPPAGRGLRRVRPLPLQRGGRTGAGTRGRPARSALRARVRGPHRDRGMRRARGVPPSTSSAASTCSSTTRDRWSRARRLSEADDAFWDEVMEVNSGQHPSCHAARPCPTSSRRHGPAVARASSTSPRWPVAGWPSGLARLLHRQGRHPHLHARPGERGRAARRACQRPGPGHHPRHHRSTIPTPRPSPPRRRSPGSRSAELARPTTWPGPRCSLPPSTTASSPAPPWISMAGCSGPDHTSASHCRDERRPSDPAPDDDGRRSTRGGCNATGLLTRYPLPGQPRSAAASPARMPRSWLRPSSRSVCGWRPALDRTSGRRCGWTAA